MKLREWMISVLPELRKKKFEKSHIEDLTILAYFFWNDNRIETEFDAMECSFLCAYNAMGVLPSVLVVNKTTPRIEAFCAKYGIKIDIDPSLNNGIESLNHDCIVNLYKRFDTKYVLIIQTDGIVYNSGIESFLREKFDYVGAPIPRNLCPSHFFSFPKYAVWNGGLSLRSKRMCRLASYLYYPLIFLFAGKHQRLEMEDMYYVVTVRFISHFLFCPMHFPTAERAADFSIEYTLEFSSNTPPIGSHGKNGFDNYVKKYGLPLEELLKLENFQGEK